MDMYPECRFHCICGDKSNYLLATKCSFLYLLLSKIDSRERKKKQLCYHTNVIYIDKLESTMLESYACNPQHCNYITYCGKRGRNISLKVLNQLLHNWNQCLCKSKRRILNT